MMTPILVCCYIFMKILETMSEDTEKEFDDGNGEEGAKLPNSHSAALAMGFVFLCVLLYCAYRLCKKKCGHQTPALTVNLDDPRSEEVENYVKKHQDYLAIYGQRRDTRSNSYICEFKTETGETNYVKERY